MNIPTEEEIRSIFGKLGKRPSGHLAFFHHIAQDVRWEITGLNALSGVWTSKSQFMTTVWLPIIKLIADPGPKFDLLSTQSILKNADGWVAVELRTSDTRTKLGNKIYSQHYCWHCKFDSAKKITEVRAFLDSSTAEAVLSEEKLKQEAAAITPGHYTAMMSLDHPTVPFDFAFKHFLQLFYLLTDAPNEHEKYVECFTPDAIVIIGSRTIQGREGWSGTNVGSFSINTSTEIYAVKSSMWETVESRRHQPKQIFPLGPNSNIAMVYGAVDYVFKDKSCKTVEWAAKCRFIKLDRVYLDHYQVFLADNTAWETRSNGPMDRA